MSTKEGTEVHCWWPNMIIYLYSCYCCGFKYKKGRRLILCPQKNIFHVWLLNDIFWTCLVGFTVNLKGLRLNLIELWKLICHVFRENFVNGKILIKFDGQSYYHVIDTLLVGLFNYWGSFGCHVIDKNSSQLQYSSFILSFNLKCWKIIFHQFFNFKRSKSLNKKS